MTQDEIIRMATEVWGYSEWKGAPLERLQRFAALVAAYECEKLKNVAIFSKWYEELDKAILAEREACAKVCEQDEFQIYETAERCAAAIRARGEK